MNKFTIDKLSKNMYKTTFPDETTGIVSVIPINLVRLPRQTQNISLELGISIDDTIANFNFFPFGFNERDVNKYQGKSIASEIYKIVEAKIKEDGIKLLISKPTNKVSEQFFENNDYIRKTMTYLSENFISYFKKL